MLARTFLIVFVVLITLSSTFSDTNNSIVKRRLIETSSVPPPPPCGSCRMREEIKNRNLEVIKGEVLRRMGFQSAPNVTGRILPPVPPHFLAKVDMEMQNDQPEYKTGFSITEEDDDYHVKTQEVLTFAQPCKTFLLLLFNDKRKVIDAFINAETKGRETLTFVDRLSIFDTSFKRCQKLYASVIKGIKIANLSY